VSDTILLVFLLFLIAITAAMIPVIWMTVKEISSMMRTAPPLQGPYFNDEESE
jgi:uncharacterized protein YneF (UPF0154 family)